MTTRCFIAIALSAAVFTVGALAADQAATKSATGDWPCFRGPDRNGISKETDWPTKWPEDGPKKLWTASIGIGFASVAISNGKAYAMGNTSDTDTVWCFDAQTGKELWKHTYPCPLLAKDHEGGPSATPTVHGDRVYTFSDTGLAFCLEAATGKVVWQRDVANEEKAKAPTWFFASSPLVIEDMVCLNAGPAGLALDKKTGKTVWSSGPGTGGYATAVPFKSDRELCLAIFALDSLVAVSAKDGKELWRTPWKTEYDVNAADPIVSGDKVFISSGYNKGCSLVKMGPEPKTVWQNTAMRNHFSSCVLIGDCLYGFDESVLKCIGFKDGLEKWSQKGLGKGSLIAAAGKLIVLSEKGELVTAEASPEGFKEISRAKVLRGKCWTPPALAGGRLYCRNAAGDLVCLDLRGS